MPATKKTAKKATTKTAAKKATVSKKAAAEKASDCACKTEGACKSPAEGHRQIRCRLGEPVVHPRARGRSRLECGSSHAVRRRRRVALGTSCCERQCDIQSPRKRFRMERRRRLRSRCGRHHHLPPEFLIFST